MKLAKYIAVVLSTSLWHTASAIPAPVPNAPSNPRSQPSPFDHRVSSIPPPDKNQGLTPATLSRPLARAPGALTNASSSSTNYTSLPGTSPCNNTLTTYCTSNSSTFVNATVGGSPPAADCAAIADTLIPRLKTGFFRYDAADRNASGIKQLQRYGACAFGVLAGDMRADSVRIGTGDVVSVIRESIRRFAGGNGDGTATAGMSTTTIASTTRNGTVGRLDAAGAFMCDDSGTMVNWALYHA
ncbi:hypothetical protein F4776DRAFT_102402 [Hypoxylon sp. NC0597]|nr:hypothetical protein F4776DRAFT_102402 [Hypoxylon sp. NC0597]